MKITDITISVNAPEEMARDSMDAVKRGYRTLKIKVGKNPDLDIERIKAIRSAVGYDVDIRIDANQGWKPKEAIRILRNMEDAGLNIEFVEQPVIADESVFSPKDAIKIIQMRAADFVNIKLIKTGGIKNALKICSVAEIYGVECMIGCMLESKISVTAAAHLAGAKSIITKIDLDGPVLCKEDPIEGGAIFNEYEIMLSDESGFGFKKINGVKWRQ